MTMFEHFKRVVLEKQVASRSSLLRSKWCACVSTVSQVLWKLFCRHKLGEEKCVCGQSSPCVFPGLPVNASASGDVAGGSADAQGGAAAGGRGRDGLFHSQGPVLLAQKISDPTPRSFFPLFLFNFVVLLPQPCIPTSCGSMEELKG